MMPNKEREESIPSLDGDRPQAGGALAGTLDVKETT